MSTPERTRAANNLGEICACLAALTSLDTQDFWTVDSSLDMFERSKVLGWRSRDNADQAYFRSVAQCFYSEICCLSTEYEKCNRLVQKSWDNIVEHFVDAILDSNTLERFPSMNLKRIITKRTVVLVARGGSVLGFRWRTRLDTLETIRPIQ